MQLSHVKIQPHQYNLILIFSLMHHYFNFPAELLLFLSQEGNNLYLLSNSSPLLSPVLSPMISLNSECIHAIYISHLYHPVIYF